MKINNTLILIGSLIALLIAIFVYWTFMGTSSSPSAETIPVEELSENNAEVLIIAFGDSLTAGYGLPLYESYPAQLDEVLSSRGYEVNVVNAGVSGETTRGNRERASFVRAQNPSIVLLGIGGNDALRFLPLSETEINIRATIEILQSGENAPKVILLRMQSPLNQGTIYKRDFDLLYETLAREYTIPLVPFITEEVFLDPALKLADGIHFNKDGYARIVNEYILDSVIAFLEPKP